MLKMHDKRLMIVIILAITPLVSFCLDEYAPSLPHMLHALNTTTSKLQLTFTVYILALGLSQWIFGLLSDRYGRRPIFHIGIIISLIGTLMCILASNINLLLIGRLSKHSEWVVQPLHLPHYLEIALKARS